MLKCYSIRDSCLIFIGSLHFGGWVDMMLQRVIMTCKIQFRRNFSGLAIALAMHLLSPTAREAENRRL
jgi:hypothetical protein